MTSNLKAEKRQHIKIKILYPKHFRKQNIVKAYGHAFKLKVTAFLSVISSKYLLYHVAHVPTKHYRHLLAIVQNLTVIVQSLTAEVERKKEFHPVVVRESVMISISIISSRSNRSKGCSIKMTFYSLRTNELREV